MYYACIEHDNVSFINYKPNAPKIVEVIEISDDQYNSILSNESYFNIKSKSVVRRKEEYITNKRNIKDARAFLNSTDWKVLRNLREKTLNIETTMSEQEYHALELQRHRAAKIIE